MRKDKDWKQKKNNLNSRDFLGQALFKKGVVFNKGHI